MGDGSFSAGFSPTDIQYHNSHIGEQFVYSGYHGKPVYASELPGYEAAAYGFPPPGQGGGGGDPSAGWTFDNGIGQWYKPGVGYSKTKPSGNSGPQQGGGFPQAGGGGFSGASSYSSGGMGDTAYQQAATNAVAQMYNRIRSRKQTSVNTDMARRGISSSGVAGGIMGDSMHELDLNETADIAKIWQQQGGGSGGSSGGSGDGGDPRQGAMGPGNMGGFGSRLPGFNSAPGSERVDSPNDGGRGTAFGNTWKKPKTTAGFVP